MRPARRGPSPIVTGGATRARRKLACHRRGQGNRARQAGPRLRTTAPSIRRDIGTFGTKVLGLIKVNLDQGKLDTTFGAKAERDGHDCNPSRSGASTRSVPRRRSKTPSQERSTWSRRSPRSPTSAPRSTSQRRLHLRSHHAAESDIAGRRGAHRHCARQGQRHDERDLRLDETPAATTCSSITALLHYREAPPARSNVGATKREQTAVALALFAFCNFNYRRSASGPTTSIS